MKIDKAEWNEAAVEALLDTSPVRLDELTLKQQQWALAQKLEGMANPLRYFWRYHGKVVNILALLDDICGRQEDHDNVR